MESTFRKYYEHASEYVVNLKWESESVEKGYEILVEKLKRKFCADVLMNKENDNLEEDIRKEFDRDFFGHNRWRFRRKWK